VHGNVEKSKYKIVVNIEEQYSLWPAHRENANGWRDTGKSGTKEECLTYVKEVWTDMRPLSLRKKMEEWQQPNPAESSMQATPPLTPTKIPKRARKTAKVN
jgi:MbtH protein